MDLIYPNHIAVIMDGNGRWAKKRGLPRIMGHRAGTDATRRIIRACGELGVNYLTLYTFSTENWSRPKSEVSALMSLLVEMIKKELDEIHKNNVILKAIGHLQELPEKPRNELMRGIEKTSRNTGLTVTVAISYGSRQEIVDATKRIAKEAIKGDMDIDSVTPEIFGRYLYDPELPDPELLIRTGGEMRVSNYLLWQIAYTELYISDMLWPDFNKESLISAVKEYNHRDRRFGGVKEE